MGDLFSDLGLFVAQLFFTSWQSVMLHDQYLEELMLTPILTQVLGREGGVRVDWRQYRVAVLKWLDGMGVTGIKELGEATMKGLMGDQEGPKASQYTALSQ